jgi:hypothetical protein
MILELKNHLPKKHSLVQRNDFIETHSEAVKLKKLAKKCEKRREFTKERNFGEEKHLNFINSILKKRQSQIDSQFHKNYLETCKFLDTIRAKTASRVNNNQTHMVDSRAPSSYTALKSSLSLSRTNSVIVPPETPRIARTSIATPISKIFTNQTDTSQNKCRYNRDNCFSRNSQFDETSEIYDQCKSSLNSLYTGSHSFNSGSSCSLFPCSLLQSYTSFVGEKNDRTVRRPQTTVDHARSSSSFRYETNVPVEVECFAQNENELSAIKIDHFENNISIRRPLRQKQSLKDFELKISALEKQAKYCKELNHKVFNLGDRNICYGLETSNRKFHRQLRLISDFVR